jgi:hypothetical protein
MADKQEPKGKGNTQSVDKVSAGSPPNEENAARVPESAVGRVTVETTQPTGETEVQTAPASRIREQQATEPRRATRQTRDQRQRNRQEAQRQRAERRQQASTQTSEERRAERQAQREANLEERTIKLSLPAHSWEALDRRIERTGQDESAYFRRLLGPLLR